MSRSVNRQGSLDSSDVSDDEPWTIWKVYKGKTSEKLLHNRTDSYKLAFPLHRKNLGKEKENHNPDTRKPAVRKTLTERPSHSKTTNLERPNPIPHQKRQPGNDNIKNIKSNGMDQSQPFKKLSVASIYAPKRTNKTPEATPRKKKSPFCKQPLLSRRIQDFMEKDERVRQKVSFSDYVRLNDKMDKLELIIYKNEADLSEELDELNGSLLQENFQHPNPDPSAFPPPIPRVRRLQINTEIRQYHSLYGVVTVFGVMLIAMTYVWLSHYKGGLTKMLNMHVLLAMIGFFFLSSQGILVYRTMRYMAKENSSRITWKANIIHTSVHIVSVVISCASIAMAFWSRGPSENLYTLHSWIGMVTFVFYILITLISLLYFLPMFTESMTRICLPIHISLSLSSFFMIVSSCLSGFMEEATHTLGCNYSVLPKQGVLLNCIGVLMMVYCGFFIYLIQTVKDI